MERPLARRSIVLVGLLFAKRNHFDVSEFDRIRVSREADMAARAILPWVGSVAHKLGYIRQIGIEDPGSIEFDLDLRTGHGDDFVIPLAGRTEVS